MQLWLGIAAALSVLAIIAVQPSPGETAKTSAVKHLAAKPPPAVQAHDFTLIDTEGKSCKLSDFRGQPVALYFFCGCEWCRRCARIWGQMQRAGAIPAGSARLPANTLVVFSGDADAAKVFSAQAGLNKAQTVLLPDTAMHVTLDLYNAEPCPRVFVIDSDGKVVYTNNHKDDAARQAPEIVIASRALSALRGAARPAKTTTGMSHAGIVPKISLEYSIKAMDKDR